MSNRFNHPFWITCALVALTLSGVTPDVAAALPSVNGLMRPLPTAVQARTDSIGAARRAFAAGKSAFDRSDFEEAAKEFERATTPDPKEARHFLWLGNALIKEMFSANLMRKAMIGPRARDAWERAAALDPRDVESRGYLVDYYAMAPAFLGGGLDKAEAMATQVRAFDTYHGLLLLCRVAEQRKDYDRAAAQFAEAARLSADDGRALEGWLIALDRKQRFVEGFAAVDDRLKRLPDDYYALYHLGRTAGLSGQRVDSGVTALRRLVTINRPEASRFKSSDVRYWLGMLLERKGDRGNAAAELRQAVEMNPADTDAKVALARVTAKP